MLIELDNHQKHLLNNILEKLNIYAESEKFYFEQLKSIPELQPLKENAMAQFQDIEKYLCIKKRMFKNEEISLDKIIGTYHGNYGNADLLTALINNKHNNKHVLKFLNKIANEGLEKFIDELVYKKINTSNKLYVTSIILDGEQNYFIQEGNNRILTLKILCNLLNIPENKVTLPVRVELIENDFITETYIENYLSIIGSMGLDNQRNRIIVEHNLIKQQDLTWEYKYKITASFTDLKIYEVISSENYNAMQNLLVKLNLLKKSKHLKCIFPLVDLFLKK
ncbi:hypothetical protein DEFDS_P169 (plasmid) [Deferribacter desulfuricans SSM1]|uniref:Uncharacterized protein n=1 Tax=Deferribacter desulfuricans (strain DSM 14783 / JCM 11476 / NBRC 101012 / SSM1) TaxID=639282 RepID=D3PEZ7_DEFDS|nr:hypothetical protein [Deferribacter desulfuricans]BAI81789.1 hypothetical protein DEFDS_P169 [Deferribacter desulfuricans SSM1]